MVIVMQGVNKMWYVMSAACKGTSAIDAFVLQPMHIASQQTGDRHLGIEAAVLLVMNKGKYLLIMVVMIAMGTS